MVHTIRIQFEEYDRTIFWSVVVVGAVGLIAYAYFLSVSIFSVIARKEAEIELGRITTEVARAESRFVELDRGIDLKKAEALGFVEIATPTYMSKNEETKSTLSLRRE